VSELMWQMPGSPLPPVNAQKMPRAMLGGRTHELREGLVKQKSKKVSETRSPRPQRKRGNGGAAREEENVNRKRDEEGMIFVGGACKTNYRKNAKLREMHSCPQKLPKRGQGKKLEQAPGPD